MSELFAVDYPMSVDNRLSDRRCGMYAWLPWLIGGTVIVVVAILVLIPRLWGGDDPPG